MAKRGRPRKDGQPRTRTPEEMSDDDLEFLVAMDRWKRENHVRFPTVLQYMEVLLSLGYRKGGEHD